MRRTISKSSFEERPEEFLREVESTGEDLVITDHGKPVLRLVPYMPSPTEALEALRGSVLRYDDPTEPVGLEDWEVLR